VKRSEADAAVDAVRELAAEHRFPLPPFADWDVAAWREHADETGELIARGLGWDVSDFGRGDFSRYGLAILTVRNGTLAERDLGNGQVYGEKIMRMGVGQETPFHHHRRKTEDIVHRGGGVLVAELRAADGSPSVTTLIDGVVREVRRGELLRLAPGSSVQMPTRVHHRFWAEEAPVLAGEVSNVNDDVHDNVFLEESSRFAVIDEDGPARWPLVSDDRAALR
jgi:D-lyxose ketol-isomerase